MELRKKIASLLDQSYLTRINNLNQSIELTNKALLLCDERCYLDLKAKAISQLSLYYMIVGDYEQSSDFSKQSIQLYEELKDEKGIADAKYSIASVYYKTNNYHIGLVFLIDALNIYKKFNDYHNISRCEKSLGTIYEYFEDEVKAIESYENAIVAAKKIKDLNLESNAYNNLSGIYIKQGNIEESYRIIEKSIKIKLKTLDIRGMAFAIYGRGKVLLAQKKYKEAEVNFKESINIHFEMKERLGIVMAYHKLAKLYVETNDLDNAKEILSQALKIINIYNISLIKFKCDYLFYTIYKKEKNDTKALEYLELYLKEKETVLNAQTLKVVDSYDMLVQMKMMQKEALLQKEKAEIIEKSNRTEEAARVRQEFLSTMSHEIRTPLSAVITIVSMLNNDFDLESKKLIEPLKFSTQHLMNIINNILDFTKLDLGKVDLDFHPENLRLLIENFSKTYEIHAKQKQIKFNLKLDHLLSDVYDIDKTKLIQMVGNLVDNAIKFTDKGTVTLELKLILKTDKFDTILFKISDTGEGIKKEKIGQIFDSFSQIKNVTTRSKGGSGLGLAIVKNLVELHGGKIIVESTYGEGTEFSFELILSKVDEKYQNIVVYDLAENFDGKKLLLAEDNAINALIAKTLVSKWGISVEHVKTGLDAIERAISSQYDYILMDIHMPEMDGFEAAKIIRSSNVYNQTIPIFGLTADVSAKDNIEFNSYFTSFLLKPLEIEKLHNAFSTVNRSFR